jgi:hypothetical protein
MYHDSQFMENVTLNKEGVFVWVELNWVSLGLSCVFT